MSVTVQARRIFVKLRIVDVGRCRRSGLRWLNTSESNVDAKQFADFKRNLRNKQVPCKDGNACLQVECRLCRDLRRSSAYINKRTGLFLCPNCDIQKNLSDVVAVYEKNSTDLLPREVIYKSRLRGLGPITQVACDAVAIKGLNVTDLEAVGAKFDASENVLQFPLKNAAEKVVGEKLMYLTDKREETLQNPSFSGLLIFGPRTHKGRLVLVSNIPDFLVLVMQRIENLCIACLPYGLGALPQECLPNLERFKEVVFWFDCDSTGWDVAKTFSKKLDEKRCFLIRPTETEPAPHEAHRKRLNIRHILFKATPMRHKSITTFSALRNDILSELQNIEKVNGVKWKRFPVLNKLLMGHRKGELTILTGPTGSGKTTFMSEYSLDLALQGVSTLWGSFEIRNCRLAATLLRQFVGYSLENKLDEFDRWASALEKYPLYFMTFHGQQPLKLVMDAVEHAQYVHDISHVIIDNLQFMMGTSAVHRLDKFWEQDAIIGAFRAFATKNNVHVTLVMHPRKERAEDDLTASSVFGTAKATQEADNVLIIQDKRLTSIRGKKYLQVVKNRYSGDLGIMPLDFDKESLSYATISKKKNGKGK